MDITQLPFNRLVGVQRAAPESGYLLSLPDLPNYHNHLGTVHASALLSLAEAASGEFLIQALGDKVGVIPVVRRMEAKFKKPAQGQLLARCTQPEEATFRLRADLEAKGRAMMALSVEVCGADRTVFLTANVEWFISMQK